MTASIGSRRTAWPLRVPVVGDGAGRGAWEDVFHTLDGLPLVVADPAGLLATVGASATAPLDQLPLADRVHLSSYITEILRPGPLRGAIRGLVERFAPADAQVGVEAGCSVGTDTAALAANVETVVSFDLNVAAARVARALAAGEPVPFQRRREGTRFDDPLEVRVEPKPNVRVLVGDALDPPLEAGCADVVIAVNLLDSVASPLNLLGQLDAMLRPGGLLVVASPFAWNDAITPPAAQFPSLDRDRSGPELLTALLRGASPLLPHLAHDILERGDVRWTVHDHDRGNHTFLDHVVASRKR